MRSPSQQAGKPALPVKEMCLLALMGALMFVMQVAMAPIRNFHMTDVLIILTAIFFGWKVMYSVFVFVVLEGLMWGFGLWVVSYM